MEKVLPFCQKHPLKLVQDFSGSLVVKALPSNARFLGLIHMERTRKEA